MDRLKPAERRALSLIGYSYREIGELTGWTRTKINRCAAEGRNRIRSKQQTEQSLPLIRHSSDDLNGLVRRGPAQSDAIVRQIQIPEIWSPVREFDLSEMVRGKPRYAGRLCRRSD